jgi:hypothetical protein
LVVAWRVPGSEMDTRPLRLIASCATPIVPSEPLPR